MTRHFTPQEIAASVRRVREGASVTALAAELGVHPTTVRNWRRHAERLEAATRLAAAGASDPTAPVASPPLRPELAELLETPATTAPAGTAAALAAAQAAAGEVESAPAVENGAPEPAGQAAPAAGPMPHPSELVDLCEGIRGIVVEVAASNFKVQLEPDQRDRIAALPAGQRKALLALAPHAAKYAPAVLEKLDKFAAVAFVAVFALGLKSAWGDVERLAPKVGT